MTTVINYNHRNEYEINLYYDDSNSENLSVQKILNERNTLIIENNQLRQLLNQQVINVNGLIYQSTNLQGQIQQLKQENQKLIEQLNVKEIKINELRNQVDILMKEREFKQTLLITAESIGLFDKLITNYIFDYKNVNKYTLNDIVYERVNLTDIELKKWNEFEKVLNIKPKDMMWYLSRLKDDRNKEFHYRDQNLNIDQIKDTIIKYVKENKDKNHLNGYCKVIDIVINTLKDEKGMYPFKDEENAPEI